MATLAAVVPSAAAQAAAVTPKVCEQPAAGQSFGRATPEQENLDSDQVKKAVSLLSGRLRLSVLVFRNNCLVGQDPLNIVTASIHNDIFSATKSVVSLLTGIAIGQGKLKIDDPIGKYLPTGPGWGDAEHRAITVRQLLNQTSGMRQSILAEFASIAIDPSLAQEALNQPILYKPGTKFQYSQLGPALLAYVVQSAVEQDLVDYAQKYLFGPIGIKPGSYLWLRDRSGLAYGYANLFLTPLQLSRLGLLMINNGSWNGTQVVPRSWVDAVQQPTPTNGCYGLLFWNNRGTTCTGADIPHAQTFQRRGFPPAPADAYEMNGALGQLVIMIPSLNITVVTTGVLGSIALDPPVLLGAGADEMQWSFLRALMAAVKDVKVPDPGPYSQSGDPIDLNVDPENYLSPGVLLSDLVTNPHCNVLFCNGTIPFKGLFQNLKALPGLL